MEDRRGQKFCGKSQAWKTTVNIITAVFIVLFFGIWMITRIGYEPYHILTGSMEPTLSAGEIVLVDTNDKNVEVGDVAAFWIGENVVIHRIQKILPDGTYITKGDANITDDFNPVKEKEIIGTMVINLNAASWCWELLVSKNKYFMIVCLMGLNVVTELYATKNGEMESEDT
ncbi:MAG: signal peptidase I [Lachnospiraceae bacterium]|nr:signal peptidase I [Lachnospiraceae bacterium]